ncbi:chemotaxis protein CheW [Caldimonas caldifontis]|uniref:Chemotaxis protein CheW n=1 Tax=Caldimonas caldifontis TaxID=1452508 RepID=A0A2S5SZW3_9BURK|nr:chemotaxis protein CheW [Caldimonas caldifontis]PPE68137.1 chemotaxis protein CheW [Caldimonas caldifontis]
MANKEALRELQSRLAERLQAARTEARTASWLAVEAAGQRFLLPLQEAGEIFPFSSCVSVPHTSPWFLGVANLRGGLHGVVDLGGFLGLKPVNLNTTDSLRDQLRLVALNPSLDINCALLVERLAGLRNRDQLAPADDAAAAEARPDFVGQRLRDPQGRVWQELNLAALARDEAFLRIVG